MNDLFRFSIETNMPGWLVWVLLGMATISIGLYGWHIYEQRRFRQRGDM